MKFQRNNINITTYPNVIQMSKHITLCQQNAAIKQKYIKSAEIKIVCLFFKFQLI